jgi:signal transduction histidine kinase/CheY-like chemotaxis protein
MPAREPRDTSPLSPDRLADGIAARVLDEALDAAEMGRWRYEFSDYSCYLSPRAQELYDVYQPYFTRDDEAVRRIVHPDDREAVNAALRLACAPTSDGRYRAEYRVRRPDNGWRWLSVWGLTQFEGEGAERHAVSMTGASRDITAVKQAAMFAEAQKTSLELIVGGASLSEVLTYLTRVVERASDEESIAAILFLDAEGRLRNGASPSLPPDYIAALDGLKAEPHVGTCSAAAATSRPVVTPDIANDPAWAAIKHLPLGLGLRAAWSQPITARDGRVLGTFGTYFRTCRGPSTAERAAVEILSRTAALAIERAHVDEALRQSQQRLRDDDRRKNEFLAALSHELRNPLAPLRTAIHLLEHDATPQTREQVTRTMGRQVDQLVRLVDDLLDVSRISRGSLELRKEPVDLSTVIALAVETSDPVIRTAGHTLSVLAPEQPVWVIGDGVRLAQILSNLLNNAARYTNSGGQIVVETSIARDEVLVSVRDTGVGIESSTLPQLFELFVRGPQAALRNRDGLGVGLALARRLAEMHGGSITAASGGAGLGSEFTLRLPLARTPAGADPSAATVMHQSPAPPPCVLVVDDNADAAELTTLLLRSLGCVARCEYDGLSAIAAAAEMKPDVILLDIGLPDLNGYEVCRRLRQEAWRRRPLIVALTGWGQTQDRLESESAGFDLHFVKPIETESLIEILGRAAASAPSPR